MRKGPAARGRLFSQRPTQPSTACTRSMAPVTAARNPTEPAKKAPAAKAAKAAVSTTEAGRVGNRPYARGRAYKPDRYEESE